MLRSVIIMLAIIIAASGISAKTISGTVVSDNDSTAIESASCRIIDGEQFIKGVLTDHNGAFTIETDMTGALTLEISGPGFNTTEIIIKPGDKDIMLGNVFLNKNVKLDEITVTAGSLTESKGRTIIYPSVADIKASSTSIKLFQKLPLAGLEANPVNRTLSVDGGTPMILINGVPSTIDDVNALQPKNIAKIEFSRVTPAR